MAPKQTTLPENWGWFKELLDFEDIERAEPNRIWIRLENARGEMVSIPFPKKSWITIDLKAKQVMAPLWFCVRTGLTDHPSDWS